jgi:hypothetical protein
LAGGAAATDDWLGVMALSLVLEACGRRVR